MRIDLTDPKLFSNNEFWSALAWLRDNEPVYWHSEPDGPGFWVVTRYRDIVDVYADHETFSSRFGMRLDGNPDAVAAVSQRMLIVSDPPDHTHLKRVLSKAFGPTELPKLRELVDDVVRGVLAETPANETNFLDVSRKVPNYVVCSMMGIPRGDWEWVGDTTTDAFEGADEDTRNAAHGEIFLYFQDLLRHRRANPGADFVSRIAMDSRSTGVPGEQRRLSDEEIVFNCNGVLAGGNETTRYSAAGGILALAQRPAQWHALRSVNRAGVTTAVEEILRWTVPGVHAMRTASKQTVIGDTRISAGDRVTVWNVSANRDEAVFCEAEQFLIDRSPNRHLTFGAGRHLCLGARLARLELTALMRELVDHIDEIELLGEPTFNASNFTWGLIDLPVRLVPDAVGSAAFRQPTQLKDKNHHAGRGEPGC
jgi:cytochrome P450